MIECVRYWLLSNVSDRVSRDVLSPVSGAVLLKRQVAPIEYVVLPGPVACRTGVTVVPAGSGLAGDAK